jgi:cyclophilin family peptidyl-prolyl cis-trans isomerase
MSLITAPSPEENTSKFFQSIARLLTYFSTKVRDDGTIALVSMANGSAPNNSLFFSTTGSKAAYKDSGGTVNYLY